MSTVSNIQVKAAACPVCVINIDVDQGAKLRKLILFEEW
jgi:hypothetical protein